MSRRIALAFAAVAATLVFVPGPPAVADPPTTGSPVLVETFTGSSVPDPAWTAQGAACLTGAPDGTPPVGAAQIPDCSTHQVGDVPPLGITPGYLQLTDESGSSAGSVLYNRPIPATAGISITFLQYQYGGTGADGIGFFLVDGATSLTATGANGGSLGYAQKDAAQQGVSGGYVGVGLDAYGNFYDDGENRGLGCPEGQRSPSTSSGPVAPNVVTVRGPGNGRTGYCYLESTTPKPITTPNSPGTTLDAPLRADTLAPSQREVNVQVTPDLPGTPARIIVEIRYTPTGPWVQELNIAAPPGIPSTYKFGLSASTGGSNDVHLVRGVEVDTIAPLSALRLEKQVDRSGAPLPPVIIAGTTIIPYQFTVTNSGSAAVETLTIDDPTITGVTCDRTTLTIAPAIGSTAVCRGQYLVPAGTTGSVVNTAVARGTVVGLGDPVESNPSTVIVPLISSMTITKSVTTQPPYAVDQVVAYSYVVTNTGGSTLNGVVVTDDRIPRQTDITCPRSTLQPADSMICTGRSTIVTGAIVPSGTLTDTTFATAQTAVGQSVHSNDAQQTINVYTDVGVTKTVDNAAPGVGTNVTFTVTSTNHGPSLAQDVVVTDVLDEPRLVLLSATPSAGTYNPTNGRWSIPSLTVGASATLQIVARVDTNAPVSNGATRTAMRQTDVNPQNDIASVALNPINSLDIAVTKSVDDDDIPIGGRARFTVRAQNNGPAAGSAIVVGDALPAGLVYDPLTSGGDGTYDPATGDWTIGALAVDGSATFNFDVAAPALGSYLNSATLTGFSPQDTDRTNNTGTAALNVRAANADLSIVKEVFPQQALVGDEVTYQVEVLNKGPEAVPGVFVTDVDPPGLSLSTTTPPVVSKGELITTGENLRWNVGPLAVDERATATITARLDTPGTKVDTVTVGAPALNDPKPADNQDTATLTADPRPVDVGVTKLVTDATGAPINQVLLDEQVTFTITAANQSVPSGPVPEPPGSPPPPVAATNVVLTDIIDPGLTIVSHTASAGTFDPATGSWTVGTLDPSATVGMPGPPATLTIVARASARGQRNNTIALATLDQADTDTTNNSASASVTVIERANLAITKTNAPGVAQPGDQVDYRVTVTNNGPNGARGVTAYDPAIIEAAIVDIDVPPGTTFDETTRVWTIGDMANGASVSLGVSIRVRPQPLTGLVVNTVVVSSSAVEDPDLTDNTAFAELFIPAADIAVTKVVDRAEALVGDTVTFTVGVDNRGPDPADAVTVDDVLPTGLTFVSAEASLGSYDVASGRWTIGDLDPIDLDPPPPAPQATLRVVARIDAAGTLINTATSDRADAFPFDPDPANNASSAVVTAVTPADISVVKSVSPATVEVGGALTVSFVVANAGPAAAVGVTLHDTFPATILPVSVSDARCAISGQDVDCALGTLTAGASVTITVAATASAIADYTNVAVVDSPTPDAVPGNNRSAATGSFVAAATTTTTIVETTTTAATSGSGGALPASGSDIGRAVTIAAGLVLLGAVAIVLTRRRRPT